MVKYQGVCPVERVDRKVLKISQPLPKKINWRNKEDGCG